MNYSLAADKNIYYTDENITLYTFYRQDVGGRGRIHAAAEQGAWEARGIARGNSPIGKYAGAGELQGALPTDMETCSGDAPGVDKTA